MQKVNCTAHGTQGIGLVCQHIAYAVDSDSPKVGFFFGNEEDTARPDAWCSVCEEALVELNGQDADRWFEKAGFKVFCACCWDEAKTACS
ncbi:hypothetical protein [Chelativorans alearense]|uniref:hypothetical protein n=1 Tax=Chelativorans alearense TaxID=2681495 RepID=UPI0013D12C50|nr:hypothetical protein [Chelativorans alearense]